MNLPIQNQILTFKQTLDKHSIDRKRNPTRSLQVNMGRLCNQTCGHCHQGAGPRRKEVMNKETINKILNLLDSTKSIETLDLTGGAPEMNPHFRYFITEAHKRGVTIIDRCNLSVLLEPDQKDTARFLAQQKVQIIASLPCYTRSNVDKQRGEGVFAASILSLKELNRLGYGQGELELNLVYNPGGAVLPGDQGELELAYKKQLSQEFGIHFNNLYIITNMPIRRFSNFLKQIDQLEDYQNLLYDNFNRDAALQMMCRDMVSIDYQGNIFDCDFNQALNYGKKLYSIKEKENLDFLGDEIQFGDHCFGCTAGQGSSCGGALVN